MHRALARVTLAVFPRPERSVLLVLEPPLHLRGRAGEGKACGGGVSSSAGWVRWFRVSGLDFFGRGDARRSRGVSPGGRRTTDDARFRRDRLSCLLRASAADALARAMSQVVLRVDVADSALHVPVRLEPLAVLVLLTGLHALPRVALVRDAAAARGRHRAGARRILPSAARPPRRPSTVADADARGVGARARSDARGVSVTTRRDATRRRGACDVVDL